MKTIYSESLLTMRAELPYMNWILSDPSGHKVGHAQKDSIIKWYVFKTNNMYLRWTTHMAIISDMYATGPAQTLRAQVSYIKKCPKYPWLLLLLHYLLPPCTYPCLRGVPYDHLMGSRKLGPGMQMALHSLQALLGSGQWTAPQTLYGTSLRDSGKGKSSQW